MQSTLGRIFLPLFTAVVIIQGVHVIEHIIQLMQVYLFDVPDDDALGLLGYLIQFNGTEEWLHLGFNMAYLTSLYLLVWPMRKLVPSSIPPWAFVVFVAGGVAVESWHEVEHVVIMSHVIRNNGCPCPGIGDVALGVTDTQLHFVYNAVAYAATVTPFWFLKRGSQAGLRAAAVG
jgi:hypothetical protein